MLAGVLEVPHQQPTAWQGWRSYQMAAAHSAPVDHNFWSFGSGTSICSKGWARKPCATPKQHAPPQGKSWKAVCTCQVLSVCDGLDGAIRLCSLTGLNICLFTPSGASVGAYKFPNPHVAVHFLPVCVVPSLARPAAVQWLLSFPGQASVSLSEGQVFWFFFPF
jgi:hypothetical protein